MVSHKGRRMSTAPDTLGFKAFAQHAGFKPSYVTQLRKAGRLVLTDNSRAVRVAESLALIRDTADPSKTGVAARHAATRAKGAGQAAAKPARDDAAAQAATPVDAEPVDYTDPVESSHARRRAKAMADKAETDALAAQRDYRLSLGELLEVAAVEAVCRDTATTLRTSFENLPNTLAPGLAAATNEARIRVLLQDAIEHALEEASRQLGALAKQEMP